MVDGAVKDPGFYFFVVFPGIITFVTVACLIAFG